MPQIMQAHAVKPGRGGYHFPTPLKVAARFACLGTWDDEAVDVWRAGDNFKGGGV
jgi:hypothetical protein